MNLRRFNSLWEERIYSVHLYLQISICDTTCRDSRLFLDVFTPFLSFWFLPSPSSQLSPSHPYSHSFRPIFSSLFPATSSHPFPFPFFLIFLFPCIPDFTPFPLISNSPNSSFILLTFHPSFLHSLFFPFIPCILLANTPQHLFPPLTQFCPVQSGHTLAVINVGAPAGGMSTAVRAFVRFSLYQGHTVLGIRDGINGLFDDKVMNTRYSFDPQITDANRGGSIFSLLNWI